MKQLTLRLSLRAFALVGLLALSAVAFAQQIDVKGHVKDAAGEPVIGATVTVGNQPVAVTDFDGNFTIKASKGTKVKVSYIGYQPSEVEAAGSLVITLQDDAKVLEQVVVIGYGRAKKEDLTGSVTAMKPDELSKGITNNAADMLVGKIAGVDVSSAGGSPGSGSQIRIRGGASLNASNDPLYVIDGLTIDNNNADGLSNILAMVNPNDIETFTVLKDASATAIYGSRASNGVIIITTKKGRSGSAPKVSYNGDVTISVIQKKYDVLTGDQYRDLVKTIDGLDPSSLGTANTDWQDEIFRTAVSHNHNISVSGGLKNMPYRVSAGFNSSDGIVKESWMRRFTSSINVAPSFLDKHLNVNLTAKYMFEKDNYPDASGAVGGALAMDPTQPVYFAADDSNAKFTGGYYQSLMNSSSISDPAWTKIPNNNAPQNPLALLEQKKIGARTNDFSGNIEVDYKIHGFEDLHIHANLGAQYTKSKKDEWSSPQSYGNNYFGWNGYNQYEKYNIVGNAYAQYMKELGNHNIDVMAGAEQSHYHRSGYYEGQGYDPYKNEAYGVQTRSEKQWRTHNSLLSYFGRLNYSFLGRYMLTATMRADGSSRFSEGNKWGYFPSVAVAWKINQESFLKDVSWMDELKLRAGWGKTGQQNGIDDFYYAPLYTLGDSYAQYPFGNTYYTTTRPNKYNPDLTWEKTTTWNGGIDFSGFRGRFSVNLDGYYRKTTDLLATVPIPAGTNFGDQLLSNIGSLENYGLELAFNVKPIVTKDFMWDISYNVGWNHNEITELKAGSADWIESGDNISRGNNTKIQRNKVGEPMNSFYVYQQVYGDDGKPIEGMFVDRNADGKIDASDGYYYKSPSPDVIMGLTTKFVYKNWDLSASFHASLGNYVYYDCLSRNSIVCAGGLFSNSSWHNVTPEAVELGWNAVSNVYASENFKSDYYVRNASYLKCTNITLGYTFASLLPALTGSRALSGRIYFTAQNPFMITGYDGLDPEVTSGIDKNPYPRPMSFQLGLNLNF